MKGSGTVPGPFSLFNDTEVTRVKAKTPRMIEARFTFQTVPEGTDPEVVQFEIRTFLRDGKLRTSIDIHGGGDGLEDLDPSVLGAMEAAIETVKGRVKASELYEQVE